LAKNKPFNYKDIASEKRSINTLTSGLIQAVCKKTAGSHVALRGNISAPVWVTGLVEVSSLVVCTRKKFLAGDAGFLWVMS